MRIAVVAPVWFPVPPTGYGGIELVVSLLADGLVDAGHDVTLFASGGSRTKAQARLADARATRPARPRQPLVRRLPRARVVPPGRRVRRRARPRRHRRADLRRAAAAATRPSCTRCTGRGPSRTAPLYDARSRATCISSRSATRNARANLDVPYAGTVHNGIDLVGVRRTAPTKERFLVYIGRANPDKGPTEAITIARRAGLPLHMILKRGEPPEREYFEREIEPLLASDVELYENVTHDEKVELLGRASAMVFPIRWPEPFGLVMVEAMACGTPVVTTNWGAAPELVDDGVTGFRRDGEDDLVEMVGHGRRRSTRRLPQAGRGPVLGRGDGPRLRGGLRARSLAAESRSGFPLRP